MIGRSQSLVTTVGRYLIMTLTAAHYLISMSTASNLILPTFLIECVTAPARQLTSLLLTGCVTGLPSAVTSISAAVMVTTRPGSGCVCMATASPGARDKR